MSNSASYSSTDITRTDFGSNLAANCSTCSVSGLFLFLFH